MADFTPKIQDHLVKKLCTFFNQDVEYISNRNLTDYILIKRIYPFSKSFFLLKNFFLEVKDQKRTSFLFLETQFKPIYRLLQTYYLSLAKRGVDRRKIFKYQNLMMDYFLWLFLNDIPFRQATAACFYKDYLLSLNYFSHYSQKDIYDFAKGLYHLNAFYLFENFSLSAFEKFSTLCFRHSFSAQDMRNLLFLSQNQQLKAVFYLVLYLGLPVQTVLRLKFADLNLGNQDLYYPAVFSKKLLRQIYNADFKEKLRPIMNQLFSQDFRYGFGMKNLLYSPGYMNDGPGRVGDSYQILKNDFVFELKNMRKKMALPAKLLNDLHWGVLLGKFQEWNFDFFRYGS